MEEVEWEELNDKATTLYQQGRFSKAICAGKEALKVAENTFGSDHANVATTMNNLALLYNEQGKYAEAEPLYKQALEIGKKAFGPLITYHNSIFHPRIWQLLLHRSCHSIR